jgi:restriction system protein
MAEIARKRQGELMAAVFRVLEGAPEGLPAKELLARLPAEVPPTPFEASEYPSAPGGLGQTREYMAVGVQGLGGDS